MTVIGVGIGAAARPVRRHHLAEYGRHERLTSVIRFINDILLMRASIIIGLSSMAPFRGPDGRLLGIRRLLAVAGDS